MIGFAAERLMELEVSAATGAGYGEKGTDRWRSAMAIATGTGSRGPAPSNCVSPGSGRAATFPASSSREWCVKLDDLSIAAREDEHRRHELTTASICAAYATEAMEQLAQAFAKCGANPVSGAHWSVTEWSGHYDWCMYRGVAPDGAEQYETHPEMDEARALRRNDLANC